MKGFRIKDIKNIELLKKDPILTYKYDELSENSKNLLKKIKPK
jgi:hypothetical protein